MQNCFNCEKTTSENMYGYPICNSCKSRLKLFSEETIKKHYLENPERFSQEIQRRLDYIEKDYLKKKIKLLQAQEQLKNL